MTTSITCARIITWGRRASVAWWGDISCARRWRRGGIGIETEESALRGRQCNVCDWVVTSAERPQRNDDVVNGKKGGVEDRSAEVGLR